MDVGIIVFIIVDEFSDQIGGKLATAREAAELSVDDVIFRTRIPRGVIVALEAGDFTFFSSPTYAKSFLSQYSSFLNVDAGPWLDALQPAYFVANEAVSPLLPPADSRKERAVRDSEDSGNWVSTLSYFTLTAGLIFAFYKGYEFFETRSEAENKSESKLTSPTEPAVLAPKVSLKPVEEPEALLESSSEGFQERPPRALIVRLPDNAERPSSATE